MAIRERNSSGLEILPYGLGGGVGPPGGGRGIGPGRGPGVGDGGGCGVGTVVMWTFLAKVR